MTLSMAWKLSTVTIRVTALSAAPAYMSRTAFRTGRGGVGRTGSGGIPPSCGYGWYIWRLLRNSGGRAELMARGSPGRRRTEPSRAALP